MKNLLSTVAIMASLTVPAFAEDISIDMLNKRDDGAKMVYSEDITRIDVGDTVTWVPTSKGHNVEFIAGPDGWDAPKKSKNNKEVSITFDMPGVYLYQCSPHKSMGISCKFINTLWVCVEYSSNTRTHLLYHIQISKYSH